ncbi:unnamed protein product [Taenia asiatica]|uniref:C2H2-type domain-containing protein n=1 Tax=Taenia asiatica TaxID=60517 RepID=A0A0R3VXL6_TAEAS|nr:unnamed protein product [Taenia asiatica]
MDPTTRCKRLKDGRKYRVIVEVPLEEPGERRHFECGEDSGPPSSGINLGAAYSALLEEVAQKRFSSEDKFHPTILAVSKRNAYDYLILLRHATWYKQSFKLGSNSCRICVTQDALTHLGYRHMGRIGRKQKWIQPGSATAEVQVWPSMGRLNASPPSTSSGWCHRRCSEREKDRQALVTVATGTCVYDSYWAMRSVVLHPLPLCAHYQLAEMLRANNGSLGSLPGVVADGKVVSQAPTLPVTEPPVFSSHQRSLVYRYCPHQCSLASVWISGGF